MRGELVTSDPYPHSPVEIGRHPTHFELDYQPVRRPAQRMDPLAIHSPTMSSRRAGVLRSRALTEHSSMCAVRFARARGGRRREFSRRELTPTTQRHPDG